MYRLSPYLPLLALIACGSPQPAPTAPEPAPAAEPAEPAPAPKPSMDVPPERAVEVKLPTGKTVTADRVSDPAPGTVEHAIIASINLITAGDFDAWIAQYCHDSACGTPEGIEAMKRFNLPAAQGTAKACLGEDGNSVVVTRRDPVEADGLTRVFVYCGEDRMPPSSAHYLVDGTYRVASLSW